MITMTKAQKKLMEEEINQINTQIAFFQAKRDAANFVFNDTRAEHYDNCINDAFCKLDGIKIALAVLGYRTGWKDNKQYITNEF